MPLTELAIKNLKAQAKLYRVSDSHGLCIEVAPSGGKLWRYRFYFMGRPQMASLGKYPYVGLAQARKLRDEARQMLKSGIHPTRQKQAEKNRRAIEGDDTFECVARMWMETKKTKLNAKYAIQNMRRLERLVFPVIGSLPITQITIPDIVALVEKVAKKGTIETAKRIKQVVSQVFRYAAQRGLCTHNPASDIRDILPQQEERHHASVSLDEFPSLLNAIESRKPDISKYVLQLLALTFVRTSELIGAKWDEIDWEREEWHIPKERMKMKRDHIVPLSRQAITILKELHKITGNRPYIFFSASSKSKHISNGTALMALRRMGYGNRMTGHGFRALASSILYEQDYKPEAIEAQLAHKDQNETRAAYNYKATYMLERKKMMQDYADYLDHLCTLARKEVDALVCCA